MKNSSEDKKKSTKGAQKKKTGAKNANTKSRTTANKSSKPVERESKKEIGKKIKGNASKKSGSKGSANEVFFVLGLAFSAFLMISLHTNWTGKLGEVFKDLFLGLFSNVGFVFPYIFILLSFALFVPKFSEFKKQIYVSSLSVFVFLSVFQGMFNLQDLSSVFWDMNYLRFAYENGTVLSGNGAFGAFFISMLYRPIGIAGLIIILLLAVTAIFIFAFYVKPSEVVEKYGTKAFHKTKRTIGEAREFARKSMARDEAHASVKYNTNTILDEINKDHLFEQKLKDVNREFEDVLNKTQFAPFDDQLEEFTIRNYQDSYHCLGDDRGGYSEREASVQTENPDRPAFLTPTLVSLPAEKEVSNELFEATAHQNQYLRKAEGSAAQEVKVMNPTDQYEAQEGEIMSLRDEFAAQEGEALSSTDQYEAQEGEALSSKDESAIQEDEAMKPTEESIGQNFHTATQVQDMLREEELVIDFGKSDLSDIKISDLKEEDFDVYEADAGFEEDFAFKFDSNEKPNSDRGEDSFQKNEFYNHYDVEYNFKPGFSDGVKHVPSPNFEFDIPKNAIEISQPVATPDYFGALESTPKKEMEIDNESKLKFLYENYKLPDLDLLKEGKKSSNKDDEAEILANVNKLRQTFQNFKIDARITEVSKGPMITRFEIQPNAGVKVSKIVGLSDDIALNLAATSVRIVAPIPGKSAIGIEIPNKSTSVVSIKDVVSTPKYKKEASLLRFGLGLDISGEPIVADLAKMPHLLIAGATGSGKSVCVNTIIASILLNAKPDEVKFLMIDPKVVELNVYNGIAHLILPVVTDPKKASLALNWAVNEMTQRYAKFAKAGVKDIAGYNRKFELEENAEYMPRIVVIIDELSDLMMAAPNQVEEAICRLAQMARACGIHLIVATQRPSVDVITGVIKANIPSRIAFAVSSQIDSRTIIDGSGAEKLLGKGDMLYYPSGIPKPLRVQGSFISEEEVEKLVEFISSQSEGIELYHEDLLEDVQSGDFDDSEVDELLPASIEFVIEAQKASTSLIQRKFRIGYNRAARIMEALEEREIVGPSRGSKPREVLIKSLD